MEGAGGATFRPALVQSGIKWRGGTGGGRGGGVSCPYLLSEPKLPSSGLCVQRGLFGV